MSIDHNTAKQFAEYISRGGEWDLTHLALAYLHLAAQLETRPRTEFEAVGWWDGNRFLLEPGEKLERGMLLFRPVSGGATIGGSTDMNGESK